MSRYNPDHQHASRTLAAAAQWRDRCLIEDGSIFTDASIWTDKVLDELDERFNRHPDNTKGRPFQEKLKRQLAQA